MRKINRVLRRTGLASFKDAQDQTMELVAQRASVHKNKAVNVQFGLNQTVCLFLSCLLILESLPSHALNKPSRKDLEGNPEKSYSLTETFFDGSPRTRPSLAESPPVQAPLLLAYNESAINQACRGIGRGPGCVSPLKLKDPKQPTLSTPAQKEQGGSSRRDISGPRETATPRSSPCSFLERLFDPSYCLALDNYLESQNPQPQISHKHQETPEQDSQRDIDYKNLSKAGKLAYWLTTILAIPALTTGLALLGYLLSGGTAALVLGFVGLALGAFATGFSYDSPGSFHEGLGNTLLTPLQIPYSILSGLLDFLSLGHANLPDPKLSPFLSKLHKATQKASTAIALAAGATLGLGALGVPYLASAAAFIPSPIAIGAGVYAGANILYRGGKAIYNKIQDNKRQSQEKEMETVSHEIGNLHEQLDSLKRELYGLGVTKLPTIKTETPRPPSNPGKNASLEERLLWNKQVKDYGQEFLKKLRDFKEQKQKTEKAREKTLKRLEEIYPQGTVVQGANNTFHYRIPELLSSGKPLADPQTAGLASYGEAILPESQNSNTRASLFSLWGPPRKQGIPVTGDYLEPRGGSTHKGTDFGAPQGTAIVVNQEAQVLFARNTQEHCQKRCLGNRGDMVALAYGNPTKEHGSFGMYTHLGWKNIARNPNGTTKTDKDNVIQGQDEPNSGISVREGEHLEPYRIIGIVGNTGRVTSRNPKGDGTHLHYQHVEVTRKDLDQLEQEIKNKEALFRTAKGTASDRLKNEIGSLKEARKAYDILCDSNATSDDKAKTAYTFLNNRFVQGNFTKDPTKLGIDK